MIKVGKEEAALRLQARQRGRGGREKAKAVKVRTREDDLAMMQEVMLSVLHSEGKAAEVIQRALRKKAARKQWTETMTSLAKDGGKMQKKPKRFGWLLGLQSKELKLEDTAVVYTKGKSKSKRLPYSAISEVGPLPAAKGAAAWTIRMSDGVAYEFHAPAADARDNWIRAVSQRVTDAKKAASAPLKPATVTPKRVVDPLPRTAASAGASSARDGEKSKLQTKMSFARPSRAGKKPTTATAGQL